ncbi:MAG: hypothetical protein P1U77_20075, partial [Rubripirellula sp.]|nr:hypothetical protein [Rubripirellula sp.]
MLDSKDKRELRKRIRSVSESPRAIEPSLIGQWGYRLLSESLGHSPVALQSTSFPATDQLSRNRPAFPQQTS